MIDKRITCFALCFLLLSGMSCLCLAAITSGQDAPETAKVYGPYHGSFIQGGLGLKKPFSPLDAPLAPGSPWSIYCWVRSDGLLPAHTLLAGFGDLNAVAGGQRFLAIVDGHPSFWSGSTSVTAPGTCTPVNWCFLAATFDGTTVRLYQDGAEAAASAVQLQPASALIQLAPQPLPWADAAHFSGKIAQFTLANRVLTVEEVRALLPQPIPLDVLPFEAGSKAWPVSTRATFGMRAPQDPATLPKSNAAISMPTAQVPYNGPALIARGADQWVLAGGWRLTEGPRVLAGAASISAPGFHTDGWLDATVPGTVLTTLIDRGLYPDPDYGLNNLAIPETLNRQDYWYRTEFLVPLSMKRRRLAIKFEGINYAAEVWFDGKRLGDIKGAFVRGTFDITDVVNPGKLNALAVRVSPPPHPGIPHEQSVKAGAGLNGGMLCLDGPTFICTEGWDWLPAIRDRNTGIWQDVCSPRPARSESETFASSLPCRCRVPTEPMCSLRFHCSTILHRRFRACSKLPSRGSTSPKNSRCARVKLRSRSRLSIFHSYRSPTPGSGGRTATAIPNCITLKFPSAAHGVSPTRVPYALAYVKSAMSLRSWTKPANCVASSTLRQPQTGAA